MNRLSDILNELTQTEDLHFVNNFLKSKLILTRLNNNCYRHQKLVKVFRYIGVSSLLLDGEGFDDGVVTF